MPRLLEIDLSNAALWVLVWQAPALPRRGSPQPRRAGAWTIRRRILHAVPDVSLGLSAVRWRQVRLLAENERIDELRDRAAAGDDHASRQLASWPSDEDHLDELRQRADRGSEHALRELARRLPNAICPPSFATLVAPADEDTWRLILRGTRQTGMAAMACCNSVPISATTAPAAPSPATWQGRKRFRGNAGKREVTMSELLAEPPRSLRQERGRRVDELLDMPSDLALCVLASGVMSANRMNKEQFRAKVSGLSAEQLRTVLWTVYWRGTAQMRERIEDALSPPGERRRKGPEPPDPDLLLGEVTEFVSLARDGAYMYGDRRVSRTERSKWRVTFRSLATQAQSALHAEDPGPAEQAMEQLIDLARDMRRYQYFHSEDPVEAARFVVSHAVSALWQTVLDAHGFAVFAATAAPQLIRWESPYGWTEGGGKVAEHETTLAEALAPMLTSPQMWRDFAAAYLSALDAVARDEKAATGNSRRRGIMFSSAWSDTDYRRRDRASQLADWHGMLVERLAGTGDAGLLDRLVTHPALAGPQVTFLQAQIANLRGDLATARELTAACLDELPGSTEFHEFAPSRTDHPGGSRPGHRHVPQPPWRSSGSSWLRVSAGAASRTRWASATACRALRISSAQQISSGTTSTARFRFSLTQLAMSGQRQNRSPAGLFHAGMGKPPGPRFPAAHSRTASRDRLVRCAMSSIDTRSSCPAPVTRRPATLSTSRMADTIASARLGASRVNSITASPGPVTIDPSSNTPYSASASSACTSLPSRSVNS